MTMIKFRSASRKWKNSIFTLFLVTSSILFLLVVVVVVVPPWNSSLRTTLRSNSRHLSVDLLHNVLWGDDTHNQRRTHEEGTLSFPTIVSAPLSMIDHVNEQQQHMMNSVDILQVKDGRFYFLVPDAMLFASYIVYIPDMSVEEGTTRTVLERTSDSNKENTVVSTATTELEFDDFPHYPVISREFPCYRTVEGSYQTMDYLADRYPQLAEIVYIGPSYLKSVRKGGREIQVLKLGNKNNALMKDDKPQPKPPLFVLCSLHSRELAPAEACARFAEDMLVQYNVDADKTWILDHVEIHLVLQANPDGREDEEDQLASDDTRYYRRKNMHFDRSCFFGRGANSGVDLNRNFPHSQWGTVGVGFYRCDETYPGKYAGSEPETRAIVDYMEDVLPPGSNVRDGTTGRYNTTTSRGVLLDIHSYGEDVFWPNAYSLDQAPNDQELRALAKKMASHTSPRYSTNNEVYLTSGDTTDWAYESIGVAAFTLEIGNSFYQRCDYFQKKVSPSTSGSLLYAARVAHAPYLLPLGPDVVAWTTTVGSSSSSHPQLLNVTVTASDNARSLGTPAQPITKMTLYVDGEHPYHTNATVTAVATKNTDGVQFRTRTETATFLIATENMTTGRHTAYVQADDTQGPGPVYAAFFQIIS